MCCSVLQCVLRQHAEECLSVPMLQCVLQCVAVCCSMYGGVLKSVCAPVLQCELQCVAVYVAAVCCRVSQHAYVAMCIAVYYNVLQHLMQLCCSVW